MNRKPNNFDSAISKDTQYSSRWLLRPYATSSSKSKKTPLNQHSSKQLVYWADASWLIQRGTAILIVPCVLFADISILTVLVILASFHLYIGVTEIFTDYIHHEVTRLLLNILFSILVLFLLKESFVILALSLI